MKYRDMPDCNASDIYKYLWVLLVSENGFIPEALDSVKCCGSCRQSILLELDNAMASLFSIIINKVDTDKEPLTLLSESAKERVLSETHSQVVCYEGMYFSLSESQVKKYLSIRRMGTPIPLEFLRCLASDTVGTAKQI